MNRLIIIGNGFDIAHGLPTKYSDFMAYLQTFEKEPQYIMGNWYLRDSITPHDQMKFDFYEKISRYIPKEDLWNSFEEALGYLDDDEVQEENSCYYIGYGDENWRDSANHDYQYMIEEDLSFASHISEFFSEWISKINTNRSPIISQQVINRNCLFLNFNYTDTLEMIYGIPADRILYIHGKALRHDKLVLGHHDSTLFQEKPIPSFNSEEEWEEYYDNLDDDFRILEAKEIIKSYFKQTYKDTTSILQNNHLFFNSLAHTNEIFILGHSLSVIDLEYFSEIAKTVSTSCKWYISYYSADDLHNMKIFANTLGISNYQAITFNEIGV